MYLSNSAMVLGILDVSDIKLVLRLKMVCFGVKMLCLDDLARQDQFLIAITRLLMLMKGFLIAIINLLMLMNGLLIAISKLLMLMNGLLIAISKLLMLINKLLMAMDDFF